MKIKGLTKSAPLMTIILMLTICSCSNDSSFFDFSVSGDFYSSPIYDHTIVVDDTPWNVLLDRLERKGTDMIPNVNISFSGYNIVCEITEDNLLSIKSTIKNNISLLPYYDDNNRICGVMTNFDNIINRAENSNIGYNFNRRNNYIDNEVKLGMTLLKLQWNNNDTIVYSYCVVSDKSGIIYDDFIINTVLFESSIIDKTNKRQKTRGEDPNYTGTKTWSRTEIADWLWGGERGKAVISHDCHFSNGHIIGQDSDAFAYMTIGNAEAERTEVAYNKISYGFGLSTPFIDISLTFNDGYYTVTFSSNSGSQIGDTGEHTHL